VFETFLLTLLANSRRSSSEGRELAGSQRSQLHQCGASRDQFLDAKGALGEFRSTCFEFVQTMSDTDVAGRDASGGGTGELFVGFGVVVLVIGMTTC